MRIFIKNYFFSNLEIFFSTKNITMKKLWFLQLRNEIFLNFQQINFLIQHCSFFPKKFFSQCGNKVLIILLNKCLDLLDLTSLWGKIILELWYFIKIWNFSRHILYIFCIYMESPRKSHKFYEQVSIYSVLIAFSSHIFIFLQNFHKMAKKKKSFEIFIK